MIRIQNLHVRYRTDQRDVHAVRGINLNVKPGDFYTLLGPSGCGKTTTLRCVAGLERPDQGEVYIGDELVFSAERRRFVPAEKRDIGMVFQSYAIWPHMTLFQNVAFPLRHMGRKFSEREIRERVLRALGLVMLDGLEERPAPFLSGGQQQRLALARALIKEPKVLLLDEPLSNLDSKLREKTRLELRDLVKRLGTTTLFVTHDQLEALTMSDVVAVMNEGQIVQEGSPIEIYRSPWSRFVANFIGLTNLLEGRLTEIKTDEEGRTFGCMETGSGVLRCSLADGTKPGDSMVLVVRPEDIILCDRNLPPSDNILEGKVGLVVFMGEALDCQVDIGHQAIRIRVQPWMSIAKGDTVLLHLPPERCRAFSG